MILFLVLAGLIALIFALTGVAKLLALPPMRKAAAESGFSVTTYRRIGAVESAGAIGIAVGAALPALGGLAGAGLLLLLLGAVIVHVRNGDAVVKLVPAVACFILIIGYLAALYGATR